MDSLQHRPPIVSTILLNWNSKEDALECLENLRQVPYAGLRSILVDNASNDGLVDIVEDRFPEVTIIRNAENLGFAEGNNIGIRYALRHQHPDYVLLLNTDTVVDPRFLGCLVNVGERHPQVGMLSPVIYRHTSPEMVWFYGGSINWQNGYCAHDTLPEDVPLDQWLRTNLNAGRGFLEHSQYLSGCALLVKTTVIRRIGLLDARFFAYYEDVDWCVRCQQAGWTLAVVPEAKIWHKSSSGGNSAYGTFLSYRNIVLFLWKYSSLPQCLLRVKRHIYRTLAEYSWDREHYHASENLTPLDGLWAGIMGKYGGDAQKMPTWMRTGVYHTIRYLLWLFRYPK